jgi:hypothetical protein
MVDTLSLEYILIAFNLILYSFASLQLLLRRKGQLKAESISDAFLILGEAVKKGIPTISNGFTWNEVIQEAENLDFKVDWIKVRKAVEAYEAYRYGGLSVASPDYNEVLSLAKELAKTR